MRVLVTGNKGYIGAVLTRMLLEKGYDVVCLDTNYYAGCEFFNSELGLSQINKDIRNISKADLEGIDTIIHLAALSNDPLSILDPQLTEDINFKATVRLAGLAKEAGIKRFIYASTCSLYGIAGDEMMEENSPLNPITPYAKTKMKSEEALLKLADSDFSPVFLRPSTAYGTSPMLRADLVVNNLTAWAFTTNKVKIMSDGTPWRPVIHVEDFSRGFIACLEAPVDLVHKEAFNLGRNEENYQIKDIAEAIQEVMPGCKIEYTYEHGKDSRTYRVSFNKIDSVLKDFFKPEWKLSDGIKQLKEGYEAHGLTYDEFIGNKYIRINQIKKLMQDQRLDKNLFWRV